MSGKSLRSSRSLDSWCASSRAAKTFPVCRDWSLERREGREILTAERLCELPRVGFAVLCSVRLL